MNPFSKKTLQRIASGEVKLSGRSTIKRKPTHQVLNAPWKRSKYGNKRSKTTAGVTYDSKGEATYAAHLQQLKLAKLIQGWERQVRIELRAGGHKVCTYVMDFVVTVDANTIELHEYKGYATDVWKMKWRLLECTLPEVTERMWPGKEVIMKLIRHR